MSKDKQRKGASELPIEPYERRATDMLDYIGTLDPSWNEKIRITREETGYTSLQILGAWVGYVLDSGTHLIHPAHPFFETGFNAAGSDKDCPTCGKHFAVKFAGQECCGDECWEVQHGVHRILQRPDVVVGIDPAREGTDQTAFTEVDPATLLD